MNHYFRRKLDNDFSWNKLISLSQILLVALLTINIASGQTLSDTAKQARESNQHHSFFHNYGPWIIAAVAGIPLFAIDKDLNKFSQRSSLHSKSADQFFVPVHKLGIGLQYAIAVPLFIGHGLFYKNNKTAVVGGELVAGLGIMGGVTGAFKLTLGRYRPYQSSSPYKFFKGGHSFYSGDVCTAFTFATIISEEYPRQNLSFMGIDHKLAVVPVFMYSTAGLVAMQRLYSNNHWSSDVFYGALAGIAVGTAVVHYGKRVHLKGFSLSPGATPILTANFNL
jgi:membrane-associated phospholipid phosphatase